MLKCDFHMHSKEDWHDFYHISYSAKDLIREAARQKFEVLSITHHNHVHFNNELKDFAKKKGILLLPGAEIRLHGKDILIVNVTNKDLARIKKIEDLERIRDNSLIIAPHPYFFLGPCLGEMLEEKIKLFHGIEYCHFYNNIMMLEPIKSLVNGNKKALATAEKHGLPMIGASDCHRLYELGTTFSWVNSEKKIDSVIDAVKKGKIRVETKPMSTYKFAKRLIDATTKEKMSRLVNGIKTMPNLPDEPFFKQKRATKDT